MQPIEGLDLYKSTVFYQHQQSGNLLIQDEDRVAFLQRQTTNDLRQLTAGQTQVSVLTSSIGRILDVLNIYIETEDVNTPALSVLTLPSRVEQTQAYLQSRIFFMDRVRIVNVSRDHDQIDLEGPAAEAVLQALGMKFPQEGALWQGKVDGYTINVLSKPGFIGNAVRLIVPKAITEILSRRLKDSGAVCLSEQSYEILRVESGSPGAGHELTEAYTPLEVHLNYAISDNKGCYTGQEVIARQINFDKITRHLVGLTLESTTEEGTSLVSGSTPAGTVTSTVISPRFGPIALAVVKRPFDKPGTILTVEGGDQAKARVTALPFTHNL